MSIKNRTTYENGLKHYRDIKNVIDTAKEEGKEEGREEGREEKEKEIIKNGISKGYSIEMIADITNISIEEIQKIANSLKK